MESNCIFCKISNKEIQSNVIYENDHTISFLDLSPNSNGHCLVIPKKHYENFEQTDIKDVIEVMKAKKEVIKILKKTFNPNGFNFVSNQGAEAFQTVFHYHEHIIPKYIKENGYTFKINKHKDDLDVLEVYKKISDYTVD
ncbi:HIT family protein [Spiroplasma turonicum]|uniref:Histidine triad protein n=1 Tax=Spiroplasma turonicum TaxID=216946 RepID=A0A0K1P6F8_9MOLU|nr:HIT family protein [Spiroplasma turonicum]AKU79457.1 histidine triad protein [Spiroplasma turonicum]ALX70479.1 histidine triad protein [Spiroplasma turonicum]